MHQKQSDAIYQAVGLSKGWIPTRDKDPDHSALSQTILWAESQFHSISSETFRAPLVSPADTHAVVATGKEKAVRIFSSEAIRVRFPNPSKKNVQGVLGLKRNDRLVNSLVFEENQPGNTSLHLLEFLRSANAERSRSLKLPDLVSLAVHSGSSLADFFPDSHVLISNLASFLIRVHVQPDSLSTGTSSTEKPHSLRDTWETYGSRFPRVSHRGITTSAEGPLQRQSAMLLYGLFVLQFGPIVPTTQIGPEQLQPYVREMFERRFSVWPHQLCDFLNKRWIEATDEQETLDFWSQEIASIARRVGQCLLGQLPIASDLMR